MCDHSHDLHCCGDCCVHFLLLRPVGGCFPFNPSYFSSFVYYLLFLIILAPLSHFFVLLFCLYLYQAHYGRLCFPIALLLNNPNNHTSTATSFIIDYHLLCRWRAHRSHSTPMYYACVPLIFYRCGVIPTVNTVFYRSCLQI